MFRILFDLITEVLEAEELELDDQGEWMGNIKVLIPRSDADWDNRTVKYTIPRG